MRPWLLLLIACGDPPPIEPPQLTFEAPLSVETRGASGAMVIAGGFVFTASGPFSAVDRYAIEGLAFTSSAAVGNGPRAVASGDLAGDGSIAIATADTGGRSITILSADAVVTASIALEDPPIDIALADLVGDARGELAVVTGLAEAETAVEIVGVVRRELAGATAILPADVDGDGDRDLVVVQSPRASIAIIENDGDWTAGEPIAVCTDPSRAVLAGGALAIGCRSGGIDLLDLRNLRERRHFDGGGSVYDLAASDFDGDGVPDLAGVDPFAHRALIWMGSAGGFAAPVELEVSRGPVAIEAVDYQEDGDPDLVVLAFEERRLDLLVNVTPRRRVP